MKIAIFNIGQASDPEVAEMREKLQQTGWQPENILEVIAPEPKSAALLRLATVLEDHPEVSVISSSTQELFFDGSVESATLYNVCVNQEVGIQTPEAIIPVSQFPQPIVSPPPGPEA